MSESFISSKFFDLSAVSASKKFIFTGCSVLTDYVSVFFALSLVGFRQGSLMRVVANVFIEFLQCVTTEPVD